MPTRRYHKKPLRFSSKLVIASATAIISYTLLMFWLAFTNIQNGMDVWPPVELTISWYAFWTVELVSLTTIKVTKVRNKYEDEESENPIGFSG